MRPIRGVITGMRGSTLEIKLESGVTIKAPKKPGLNVGKPVLVSYDFTRGKIKNIFLEAKHEQSFEMKVEEPETVIVQDEDDGAEEVAESGFLDSGALPPSCEGFWNPNSGMIELDIPDFEE
jgi:hypothetical protein